MEVGGRLSEARGRPLMVSRPLAAVVGRLSRRERRGGVGRRDLSGSGVGWGRAQGRGETRARGRRRAERAAAEQARGHVGAVKRDRGKTAGVVVLTWGGAATGVARRGPARTWAQRSSRCRGPARPRKRR